MMEEVASTNSIKQGSGTPTYDTEEIWKILLEQVQLYISAQNYSAWFKNTNLTKIDGGIATVLCPSNFARDWLDSNHSHLIKKLITDIIGQNIEIVFQVGQTEEIQESPKEESVQKDRYENMNLTPDEAPLFNVEYNHKSQLEEAQQKSCLNPQYIFKTFVVGPSNQVAHAAAEAVATNPGKAYNPLFIYGGVGLGKTHLAHAIGNRILDKDPNKKILYCSSETFLNEMVEAIRNDQTIEFRNNYRKLDLLVIDDIQFISGMERTQIEIFHTFNSLYNAGKQIILISDRPPKEIENLTDRLRSRFEGGMLADISTPDFELRVAIVKQKALKHDIELPVSLLSFIAKEFKDNIRELEGALTRIGSHIKFGGSIPNEEELAKILNIDAATKRKNISPKDIIKNVCKNFGVSTTDVKGKRRTKEVVVPRQVCMYMLRRELELPLEKVAHELNRSDHTTVLHAIDRVEEKIEEDSEFREIIEGFNW